MVLKNRAVVFKFLLIMAHRALQKCSRHTDLFFPLNKCNWNIHILMRNVCFIQISLILGQTVDIFQKTAAHLVNARGTQCEHHWYRVFLIL